MQLFLSLSSSLSLSLTGEEGVHTLYASQRERDKGRKREGERDKGIKREEERERVKKMERERKREKERERGSE